MKLLDHNSLFSTAIGIDRGFPLQIKIVRVERSLFDVDEPEGQVDVDFLKDILSRINYKVLVQASKSVQASESASNIEVPNLPEKFDPTVGDDDQFWKDLHFVLLEIDIMEGSLVCPKSGVESLLKTVRWI